MTLDVLFIFKYVLQRLSSGTTHCLAFSILGREEGGISEIVTVCFQKNALHDYFFRRIS